MHAKQIETRWTFEALENIISTHREKAKIQRLSIDLKYRKIAYLV